MFNCNSIIIKM